MHIRLAMFSGTLWCELRSGMCNNLIQLVLPVFWRQIMSREEQTILEHVRRKQFGLSNPLARRDPEVLVILPRRQICNVMSASFVICDNIARNNFRSKTVNSMTWRTATFSKQWKENGAFWSLDDDWMTWRATKFQNNEKAIEHSDLWIMTGWHGKQRDSQNNEKTMEHSNLWIMTGWNGEQRNFQDNKKTMKHSDRAWIRQLVKISFKTWEDKASRISDKFVLVLNLFCPPKTDY